MAAPTPPMALALGRGSSAQFRLRSYAFVLFFGILSFANFPSITAVLVKFPTAVWNKLKLFFSIFFLKNGVRYKNFEILVTEVKHQRIHRVVISPSVESNDQSPLSWWSIIETETDRGLLNCSSPGKSARQRANQVAVRTCKTTYCKNSFLVKSETKIMGWVQNCMIAFQTWSIKIYDTKNIKTYDAVVFERWKLYTVYFMMWEIFFNKDFEYKYKEVVGRKMLKVSRHQI